MKNRNLLLHACFWLCPIFFVPDLTIKPTIILFLSVVLVPKANKIMFPQFSEKNYFFIFIFKKNGGKKVWNFFMKLKWNFFYVVLIIFHFLEEHFLHKFRQNQKVIFDLFHKLFFRTFFPPFFRYLIDENYLNVNKYLSNWNKSLFIFIIR